MSNPLPGPPIRDGGIPFSWFNWFRKLYRSFTELYDYTYTLPTTSGGKLKTQLLTIADSSPWTWPDGVDGVWVTMIGGGAGGRTNESATLGAGGGGAGEYTVRRFYPRLSATTTTFTIGTKGASDSNGNPTTFGNVTVQGGYTSSGTAGWGGKGGGDAQTAPSSKVAGARATIGGLFTYSGSNGGGGGIGAVNNGFIGGGCENIAGGFYGTSNTTRSGGGGGGSSPWGQGGTGGNGGSSLGVCSGYAPLTDSYGAGGGGGGGYAGSAPGGTGQDGCILLEWVE